MLERTFYDRPTLRVARELIGCVLVHVLDTDDRRRGRIVETEAYVGHEDAASHAHRGLTKRNAPMFGPAGVAYVYLIYGMHHCLNVVTEREGFPAAVLIRALEPIAGIDGACNGPGRLTRSLEIDRTLDGVSMIAPPLYIEARGRRPKPRIKTTPRIGVAYAGRSAKNPWRFVDADSAHLSLPLR